MSTFKELLNKDNSVLIHHRNLQVLATNSNNLRRNDTFEKRQVHSVYHSTELLSFLDPKVWDLVPVEFKQEP